ncbi:MAG: type IX secretion system membrane protein PorP/SprF [Flavobacteriales bacterium]|nr:type IX secretion system membrane protein PorP/SprF [Flavobacteriales bacterium]
MSLNKLPYLIAIVVMLPLFGKAQDVQFSQFYAAPMYLNPAFTGNTEQSRVAANYRKQWLKVPGAFTSSSVSYDHFLRKYNSGVGIMFLNDQAGSGALSINSIGALYSYVFHISRAVGIRAGVRASYVNRELNFFALKFADQIIRGDPFYTVEIFDNTSRRYFDFGTGAILFTNDYWAGFSLDHLNQPNESFLQQDTRTPIKYTIQGGYRYVIANDTKGNPERAITMVAIYKGQQDWDQIDLGGYYKYKIVLAGLWYRGIPGFKAFKPGYSNNDALVVMLGLQLHNYFHVGYSYDATISKLGLASQGSHEISLIYEFAKAEYKRSGKKQNFMVPCTKF